MIAQWCSRVILHDFTDVEWRAKRVHRLRRLKRLLRRRRINDVRCCKRISSDAVGRQRILGAWHLIPDASFVCNGLLMISGSRITGFRVIAGSGGSWWRLSVEWFAR